MGDARQGYVENALAHTRQLREFMCVYSDTIGPREEAYIADVLDDIVDLLQMFVESTEEG
jgi:hypothetical protein